MEEQTEVKDEVLHADRSRSRSISGSENAIEDSLNVEDDSVDVDKKESAEQQVPEELITQVETPSTSLLQRTILLEQLPFADSDGGQETALADDFIRKGCAPFGDIEYLQSTPHAQEDHKQWLVTFSLPPRKGIFVWTTKHGLQLTYPDERAIERLKQSEGAGAGKLQSLGIQSLVANRKLEEMQRLEQAQKSSANQDSPSASNEDVQIQIRSEQEAEGNDFAPLDSVKPIRDVSPISPSKTEAAAEVDSAFLPPPEIQADESLAHAVPESHEKSEVLPWTPPSIAASSQRPQTETNLSTVPPSPAPLSSLIFPAGFPTPPPGFSIPTSFETVQPAPEGMMPVKQFIPPPMEALFGAPKPGYAPGFLPHPPPMDQPADNEYVPGHGSGSGSNNRVVSAGPIIPPPKPVTGSVLSRPSALDQAPGDHCIRCGRKDHSFMHCNQTRTIANRNIAPLVDGSLLNPHSGEPYCSKYQQDRCTNKHCQFLHTCSLCHRRGHGAARCFDATGKTREEIPTLASGAPPGFVAPPRPSHSMPHHSTSSHFPIEDIEDLSTMDADSLRQKLTASLVEVKRISRLRLEESHLLQERSSRVIELDRIVRRLEQDANSHRRREDNLEQAIRDREAANHQLLQERDQAIRDCKQAVGDFEAESHFRRGLDRKVLTMEEELAAFRRGSQNHTANIDYSPFNQQQNMPAYPNHPRSASSSFSAPLNSPYNGQNSYQQTSTFPDDRGQYRAEIDPRGPPNKRARHEENKVMNHFSQGHTFDKGPASMRQDNFPLHHQPPPMPYNQQHNGQQHNLPQQNNMYGSPHIPQNNGHRY